MAEGDILWRRPATGQDGAHHYPGPPVGEPPPAGWQPTIVYTSTPLPPIDHSAVDAAEERAARLTYAVGLAALGTMLAVGLWRLF